MPNTVTYDAVYTFWSSVFFGATARLGSPDRQNERREIADHFKYLRLIWDWTSFVFARSASYGSWRE